MDRDFLKARLKKESVPQVYRFIAPFHDFLALLVESKARTLAAEMASLTGREDVLEVAVGTGLSFQELVARNPDGTTIGVDITPAMLKRARRRIRPEGNPGVELHPGDAYDLPFADASFNVVFNSYMFDMLAATDFSRVLAEFYRVLKPGGRLIMVYMTPGHTMAEKMWDGLYRIHPFLLGGCRGVRPVPYLGPAGFTDVETRRVSFRTFPSEIVRAFKPTGRSANV